MNLDSLLLIQHGDRKTTHTLRSLVTIVGRDTSCELFFADRRMSRRHARFEMRGEAVELVDLASRNGCWVNGARVSRQRLHPGDIIRIGSLRMSFFQEEGAGLVDESDVSSAPVSSGPGDTLAPPGQQRPEAGAEGDFSEPTPELVAMASDETLASTEAPRRQAPKLLSGGVPAPDVDRVSVPYETVALRATRVPRRRPSRPATLTSWSSRLAASVFVLGLIGYLLPGVFTFYKASRAFEQESLSHAQTLVDALVELNRPLVAQGRFEELTVQLAERSERVRGAWIVGADSRVLLQSGPRTLAEARGPGPRGTGGQGRNVITGGDYLLRRSLLSDDGTDLGSVVVAYRIVAFDGVWLGLNAVTILLSAAVALVCLAAFYWYLRRLALGPVAQLESQLGALEQGDLSRDLPARFREWEGLRKGVNRLRDRVAISEHDGEVRRSEPAPRSDGAPRAPDSSRRS